MKVGIIDLGTNTFNLLIAEIIKGASFDKLLNTKSAVMLGNEGINEGYISDKAFTRAYGVLRDFSQMIKEFNCEKVVAFGTSAIRDAKNSASFINKIKKDFGIEITTITGDKEAEYIYYGVSKATPFNNNNYLILDIGGGSNEFIIANKHKTLWKHSFKLGGARLLNRFNPSDPITASEIDTINSYLTQELSQLFEAVEKHPVKVLVGSSGAFDSFAEIIHHEKTGLPLPKIHTNYEFSNKAFDNLYKMIISSTRKFRLLIPGMEAIRVDTIVMATVFTKFVMDKLKLKTIIQSDYSLKEGVAAELEKTL